MSVEAVLAIVFVSIVSPFLTALLKRVSWIDETLGAAINLAVCIAIYSTAWFFLRSTVPEAPQDWLSWLSWGLAAAGIGGAANNIYRKRIAGGS